MSRILVAASPEPRPIVERILAGHQLAFAGTIEEAEQLLHERPFDLIICTVAFDESRIFDLVRLAKSTAEWRQMPFLGAGVRHTILRSPVALQSVAFACRALGAEAFLDIADYEVEPEREMRDAIERLLSKRSPGENHTPSS